MTNFIQTLATFCLAVQALVSTADGTSSLPVRPPLGTRAGFLVKDPSSTESPSFSRQRVSAGIRSACARERAFTWNKERAGASAATRLRGGSWGSTPFVPQVLADADKPPEQPTASNSLDSCVSRRQYDHNHEDSQYVVAKGSVLDDADPEGLSADQGADGRSGNRNDVGGGGGGARVGVLPSLPKTLPSGKAAVHKKFAWVP